MRRRTRWIALAILLPLSLIAGASLFVYTCRNPSDQVTVTLTGLPDDTDFACIIVRTDSSIDVMHFYRRASLGGPAPRHPARFYSSFQNEFYPDLKFPMQWRSAQRYGIAMRSKDAKWQVAWFPPGSVQLRNRLPILGGGEVILDASQGQVEPLSDADLKALGLDQVGKP